MERENHLICRSLDSIERSLLRIFNLSKKDLENLLNPDYEILYEKCFDDEYEDFQDFLFDKIVTGKGIQINHPTQIHWFHGSRCFDVNDYRLGIQPLNQVFPQISERIDQKAAALNIPKQNPSRIDLSYTLLQMKLSNESHWGPFAMLNRNVIINPKQYSCYNYKEEPEIVRDYINAYYSNARGIIGQSYKNATQPCIVEFWTPYQHSRNDTLETALYSLFCNYHHKPQSLYCNTCYSAEGIAVPHSQIVGIEILENTK